MKTIIILLHPVIYFVSMLMPKSMNVWVFGAWFGQRYADNSKYLFEEVCRSYGSTIRAVWVTQNREIHARLIAQGYECYLATSLKGIYIQLIAGVFVCSVNSKDFLFSAVTPRSKVVQLWHGSPLKKINYDVFRGVARRFNLIRSFLVDRYAFVISPSKIVDRMFMSAFLVDKGHVIRAGYPRCDGLFLSQEDGNKLKKRLQIQDGKKLLLYLPTHRADGEHKGVIVDFLKDLQTIDAELARMDILLAVKPHFYDLAYLDAGWRTENILVIKDEDYDLYELLAVSDGLLTDYSSVMFDYEVTQKPMLFYMPDFDSYTVSERELYYEVSDIVQEYYETAEELILGLKKMVSGVEANWSLKLEYNERVGSGNSKEVAGILVDKLVKR